MTTNNPGTRKLDPRGGDPIEVATAVNAVIDGKVNSYGSVTLTAGAASTTVTDPRVGVNSAVFLFPQTANAAAEFGNGTIYIAPGDHVNKTSFKITHANNANADKSFFWVLLG